MIGNTLQAQSIFAETSTLNAPLLSKELQSEDRFIALLKDLKRDDTFQSGVRSRKFRAGEVVATAENLAQEMFILLEGAVKFVCANPNGRVMVVSTLKPGAIFGEGSLETAHASNIFAEAVEATTVWIIPRAEARAKIVQYPILSWGLLKTHGERLSQVENNLEDVAYKTLPERLAALLINLANEEDDLVRGVSHQTLADYLGTYRETVSAILREFKRQELVQLGYRRIVILDRELLEEMAGLWTW